MSDNRIKQPWLTHAELEKMVGGTWTPSPHTHIKADITDTPWAWADVSKAGSNLTDLATRQHAGLTDVTSGQHHAELHGGEHEPTQPDQIDLVFNSQKWMGQTLLLTAPANGQIIRYVSGDFRWENFDLPAAGLHATTHEPTEPDQIDLVFNSQKWSGQTMFLDALANGQILVYDSVDFRWENRDPTYVRTDVDTDVSAHTEWQDSFTVRLGNGADFRMWHDATHHYFRGYKHGANLYIQMENAGGTNKTYLTFDPDLDGVYVGDHSTTFSRAQLVGVCAGTGAAPAANTTSRGSLFIKYTA